MTLTRLETSSESCNNIIAFPDPAAAWRDPDQVLHATALSRSEKRALLSSWASDARAVESKPWLRHIPGRAEPVPLASILAALRRLDDDFDPPPKGGIAIRLQDARRRSQVVADAWQRRRSAQRAVGRPQGRAAAC